MVQDQYFALRNIQFHKLLWYLLKINNFGQREQRSDHLSPDDRLWMKICRCELKILTPVIGNPLKGPTLIIPKSSEQDFIVGSIFNGIPKNLKDQL